MIAVQIPPRKEAKERHTEHPLSHQTNTIQNRTPSQKELQKESVVLGVITMERLKSSP
jgi:hypothetical protein